ncbi:MAG: biosynthetic arginine decarboxylase [Chlamydiae bacterium CG10_big_fil_rev_8_21_14_0_10_35_9]|nr:MAG: biosynthetic arginine decarboxylase [Chlamydiae bacterium CG10_big_fil_rev_8_21_14_0_10_35_9]
MNKNPNWDISHNNQLYWIEGWGDKYFSISNDGDIIVKPSSESSQINLYDLTKALVEKKIEPPILFRFDGIIKDRVERLNQAFEKAIQENNYQNYYQLAYPIKVNQQKKVVDSIRKAGKKYKIGLEVGSKPELLAVLSLKDYHEDSLLLCNGYKDIEYIELAILARKIGKRPIIIIEQFYELDLVLDIAEKLKIEPEIGIRIKPFSKGSGRWSDSSGEFAKFGLEIQEVTRIVNELKRKKKDHLIKLLHFHIGSQLTSILPFKKVLREASRVYVELAKICPSICFFDIGGGLAVDYNGSQTSSDCSMNYSLEDYAHDVVDTIGNTCNEEDIAHPVIISESGRAIIAHSSVLITEVIDVSTKYKQASDLEPPPSDNKTLNDLFQTFQNTTHKNCLGALHTASHLKEVMLELFLQGEISLQEREYGERVFSHLLDKIHRESKKLNYIPEEIEKLKERLIDLYFCNFSVFQSLPDFWAIEQLFPIMPIHRLNTQPTRKAIIVDLSCDSDGKVHQFVQQKKPANYLPLHELNSSPYFIGIFLVGAYQEALGGLHNLFGDTNVIHIDVEANGSWKINSQINGDTVKEVLGYFQYPSNDLTKSLNTIVEKSLKNGRLTREESDKLKKRFKDALGSYTYLVV